MICVQSLCNVLSEQLKVFAKDKTALHSLLPNKRNILKCVMTDGGFLTTTKDVWNIKICRRARFSFSGWTKLIPTWICKNPHGFAYLFSLLTKAKMKFLYQRASLPFQHSCLFYREKNTLCLQNTAYSSDH